MVKSFNGNTSDTYTAVYNAAQKMVDTQKLTGIFDSVNNPIIVVVNDYAVHVGGNVIDGVLNIGTFFVK